MGTTPQSNLPPASSIGQLSLPGALSGPATSRPATARNKPARSYAKLPPVTNDQLRSWGPSPVAPGKASGSHQEKGEGVRKLMLVKIGLGGVLVGGLAAISSGAKARYLIPFDMALGGLEALFAKWILQSPSPVAEKLLGLSSRFARKSPDKPVSQMSDEEKEKALAPVSAAVTVISALATAELGDKLHHRFARPKVSAETVSAMVPGLKKTVNGGVLKLQQLSARAGELPLAKLLNQSRYGYFAKIVAAGLSVGWLEGFLAEKLAARSEAKETRQG